MVFGSSDHLCRRCCFHVAVRAAFGGANRTLDPGLSAEGLRCSTVKAIPNPINIKAIVALKRRDLLCCSPGAQTAEPGE
jgi:hypothetical protein